MKFRWALALLFAPCAAGANPPRYAVCHEEIHVELPKPSAERRAKSPDDWLSLPRRRPPRLGAAKLEVFEVAEVDPMPSRRSASTKPALVRPEEPPVVAIESRNNWYCIGVPRGTPGILRTIGAAPGTRFYGHPYVQSWRQENMEAAGDLGISKATSLLRRELDRPIPKNDEAWHVGELERSKHAAARALADLGDTASAPRVLAFLRSLERDGFNLWRDTLDSLARLDPALAQKYALELLERSLKDPEIHSRNVTLHRDVLPLVTQTSPGALATLRKASGMLTKDSVAIPHGGEGCMFLAARVRLGDQELARELRAELGVDSLSTQRGVECYSTLMPALYPGKDASEADVWMHRHRYEALLDWLEAVRNAPADATLTKTKQRVLDWLRKRSKEPDVAGDRTRNDFIPSKRALHLAALAALGDATGQKQLEALVADPNDDGIAPWIAASHAVSLELPRARELAAIRLRIAMQQHMRRFSTESWPHRGGHVITEHGRVVEALAERGDENWVLGLLDREGFTRELSIYLLARKAPANACAIVAEASRGATDDAVDDALWALSLLGDRCRDAVRKLVHDSNAPPHVRGMASEYLAMLRDPSVPGLREQMGSDRRFSPALARAGIIYRAPE